MKKFFFIAASFGLTVSAFAANPSTQSVPYSPYADLTINTHWDPNYEDMEPMELDKISQKTGINNYYLAFITDIGNCNPGWGGLADYSLDKSWGKHLTDRLKTAGIKYAVSLGGAAGSDISRACTDSQLVNRYEQVISTYQPNGLDFDIENGTADVPKVMNALMTIQCSHPELKLSFTLPVMPEGLTQHGKDIILKAQNANLNFSVNIMAMDYGDAYPGDMAQYAIQAATNTFNFLKSIYPGKDDATLWKMIQVTPMIGVNDVNVEKFTLANTDTLRNFAQQQQLDGLAMWSIARDQPCPDKWASPTCSGDNLQSVPYEFSAHFLG